MTQNHYILADVGGTNARFAYGSECGVDEASIRRYRNDDFADFNDVLSAFLSENPNSGLRGGCFAIAGPVSGKSAKLTNRPWTLDQAKIAEKTGTKEIALINDLSALGHAAQHLKPSQISPWRHVPELYPNGQSMVIGLGTGVNVSVPVGQKVMAAEIGHSSLSIKMAKLLTGIFPEGLDPDTTVEDFLSGRGFETIFKQISGRTMKGEEICWAAKNSGNTDARAACDLYAALAAELLRELAVHYLPMNGIYLAGSVARGIFQTPSRDLVTSSLADQDGIGETLRHIPVSLISDDAAALRGCLSMVLDT